MPKSAADFVADLLASEKVQFKHYGVKGMRWGVRRTPAQLARARGEPVPVSVRGRPGKKVKTSGGQNRAPADDAINAARIRQQARASTTDSLSNKDLQELVTRWNLEQQYSKLASQRKQRGPILSFVRKQGSSLASDEMQRIINQNPSKPPRTANFAPTVQRLIKKRG